MVAGRKLNTATAAPTAGGLASCARCPRCSSTRGTRCELVWSTSRRADGRARAADAGGGRAAGRRSPSSARRSSTPSWRPSPRTARRAPSTSRPCSATSSSRACWSPRSRRAQRGLSTCQSLLRAQLGQRVNEMILEKALTLELRHFEDSEFYDKLTRARREASTPAAVARDAQLRPGAERDRAASSFGTLLAQFSPWAVLVLLLAGLPSFVAEAKFSGDAFRLFRWRSPETRMQMYLETVLAREDHAKEVKLFEPRARCCSTATARSSSKVLRGGPRAHDPPRHLGLLPRPDQHRARSTPRTPGSPSAPCAARSRSAR
ncbi:MAG: hypothetical protein MZW92_13840 [Comamonadaceae bacterium]|nr:hypothetical protein [Comamonadaceae bacterium]